VATLSVSVRLELDSVRCRDARGFGSAIDERGNRGEGQPRPVRADGPLTHAPTRLGVAVVLADRERSLDPAADVVLEAFDAHAERLHGFARAAARDDELGRDIVQESFVRLLHEIRAGRTPDNVAAWLFRVASNLAVSHGRRRSTRDRILPFLQDGGSPATPEERAIEREADRAMRAALGRLGSDARVALLLVATGMSAEEVGRTLGRTANATRALVCRSRQQLRAILEQTEDRHR
jgi:RNA polymerase sigma-70 factor (ECF subfamily)